MPFLRLLPVWLDVQLHVASVHLINFKNTSKPRACKYHRCIPRELHHSNIKTEVVAL